MKKMEKLEEIKNLQEELGARIYELDKRVKHDFNIEALYDKEMRANILETNRLDFEVGLYDNAIKMHEAGSTYGEIQQAVDRLKGVFARNLINYQKRTNLYNDYIKNKDLYTPEQLEKLEADYKDIVLASHPAILLNGNQFYNMQFNQIRSFYMTSNYEKFYQFINENTFPKNEFKEGTDLDKVIEVLKKNLEVTDKNITKNEENQKRITNIEAALNDEIKMGQVEIQLREHNYKQKEKLKQLKQEAEAKLHGEIVFQQPSNKSTADK